MAQKSSLVLIILHLDSDIAFSKTAFELKVKSVLWFIVHGSQVVMVFWFRKSAVFYLPPGWFGPAQRFLSWPFAPAGKKNKVIHEECIRLRILISLICVIRIS